MNRGNCLNYQMPNTTTATIIQGCGLLASVCSNSSSTISELLHRECSDCHGAQMTTIPHRELRNNGSKILERVKNGETIDVTNNGE